MSSLPSSQVLCNKHDQQNLTKGLVSADRWRKVLLQTNCAAFVNRSAIGNLWFHLLCFNACRF